MSTELRVWLERGPVVRAHYLRMDLLTSAALRARAERFFAAMQDVAAPSPHILVPLFILLCQQITLLVKSMGARQQTNTTLVFQVRRLRACVRCGLARVAAD